MRVKNMFKNGGFAILSQLILILFGFFSNRVLNYRLGEALVGVNGVANNILGILSVTELGFSTAVVYHLYRTLDSGDERATSALMNLYAKVYRVIGCVISLASLLLMPIVPRMMKDCPFTDEYVRVIFLIWVVKTIIPYFFTYKRSILIADQREFVVSLLTVLSTVLGYSGIIVVVSLTGDYCLAMCVSIAADLIMALILNIYVKKHYPYLSEFSGERIGDEEKKTVFSDIKNIFFSRLAAQLLHSTDNIIISTLIGVAINGLYNNYIMVAFALCNLFVTFAASLQPTVANIFLEGDRDKDRQVFRELSYTFFIIAAIVTTGLSALTGIFVGELWLGEGYLLPHRTGVLLAVNVGIIILSQPVTISVTAAGMFKPDKWISLTAAFINLALSIALALPFGVDGVIFGSIAANSFGLIFRIIYFYRDHLNMSVKGFMPEFASYLVCAGISVSAGIRVTGFIDTDIPILDFLLGGVGCVFIALLISVIPFIKTDRFKGLINILKNT